MECSVFFREEGEEPIASETLVVRVSLWSKFKGQLFWVLLLPLLLLKENRTWKAAGILLPYYAWRGLVAGAMSAWLHGLGVVFGAAIPLLAILGGILLLGGRLQKRGGGKVLLAALAWAALVQGIWIWEKPVEYAVPFAVVSSVVFLLVVVALALTRLCLRRRYGGWKLALCPLPILLALAELAMVAASGTVKALFGVPADWGTIFMEGTPPALGAGLVVHLVLLSFLAAPLASEFHRARLCGILKLKRDVPAGS